MTNISGIIDSLQSNSQKQVSKKRVAENKRLKEADGNYIRYCLDDNCLPYDDDYNEDLKQEIKQIGSSIKQYNSDAEIRFGDFNLEVHNVVLDDIVNAFKTRGWAIQKTGVSKKYFAESNDDNDFTAYFKDDGSYNYIIYFN